LRGCRPIEAAAANLRDPGGGCGLSRSGGICGLTRRPTKFPEATMTEKNRVISPEGLPRQATAGLSQPLDTLVGKTIGEVYNNHFKGELMFQTYRRLLKEKFPGVRIIPFTEFPTVFVGGDPDSQKRTAREIAALAKERGCDAIITGNGG
jgi:hypothetical protein